MYIFHGACVLARDAMRHWPLKAAASMRRRSSRRKGADMASSRNTPPNYTPPIGTAQEGILARAISSMYDILFHTFWKTSVISYIFT